VRRDTFPGTGFGFMTGRSVGTNADTKTQTSRRSDSALVRRFVGSTFARLRFTMMDQNNTSELQHPEDSESSYNGLAYASFFEYMDLWDDEDLPLDSSTTMQPAADVASPPPSPPRRLDFETVPWANWSLVPSATPATPSSNAVEASVTGTTWPLPPLRTPTSDALLLPSVSNDSAASTRFQDEPSVASMFRFMPPPPRRGGWTARKAVLIGVLSLVSAAITLGILLGPVGSTPAPVPAVEPAAPPPPSLVTYSTDAALRQGVVQLLGLAAAPAPGTPQSAALDWLTDHDMQLLPDVPPAARARMSAADWQRGLRHWTRPRLQQRYALAVVHTSTGRWNTAWGGWTTDSGARQHECHWPGVKCTAEQVTSLEIGPHIAPLVRGTIPPELGGLVHLGMCRRGRVMKLTCVLTPVLAATEQLKLVDALLTGSVPSTLYLLPKLYSLHIQNTNLSATIPTLISELSNLLYFNVMNAGFAGSIPSSLGKLSLLRRLYLSQNDLTGTLPTTLGRLTHLGKLYGVFV
jgi:Leucine-rich repeat (LRR) protein